MNQSEKLETNRNQYDTFEIEQKNKKKYSQYFDFNTERSYVNK